MGTIVPILLALALLAMTGTARGQAALEEDQFRARCVGCHAMACNRIGPKLKDVIGRTAGSVADYTGYTDALKKSGLVWSEKTLDRFLQDPGALVPGTSMATAGGKIASAKERRMLIDFIKRADTSLDLCY